MPAPVVKPAPRASGRAVWWVDLDISEPTLFTDVNPDQWEHAAAPHAEVTKNENVAGREPRPGRSIVSENP